MGMTGTNWVRAIALVVLSCLATAGGVAAQGKRLGLVIGIGDYGEVKHPTALQDAALVSQSLKQAGFEVSEGANLSQNEFRATFRDFVERANAAGPDALLAIYLSGIALQDDGENVFLPVGARMRQRSDLSLEGLRIGDFLRSLSGIPAGARIVMLDAGYTHPIGQLVAEGGRGLAPVEKRDGLLVSFNQSPDQSATLPRTNYSAYAMALAEALREPGLDLNALFERVRLRVHDLSQGAETPWHINGLASPIVLTAPVAEAPVAALPPETAALRTKPITELDADDAYTRAIELDTIPAYEAFLRAHPTHAQAKRIRAMIAARREAYYWQRARRANTDRAYWTYLRRYPNGAHAGEAEARLARLSAPVAPPSAFEEIVYDDLAPPMPEEIEVYETVVMEDRWGALPPPSGYAQRFLPPPPVEIIELAPPPPNPAARLLPAVAIGAGVIGAAILANRAWKRPPQVRPVVAPPIVRPPRQPLLNQPPRQPIGTPGAIRPPQPGIAQPPIGQLPPGGQVLPGAQPPGTHPPGAHVPPGVNPPRPGQITPPPGAPTGIQNRPTGLPPQGTQPPLVPGQLPQTAPKPLPPGATPPNAVQPGVPGQPPQTAPKPLLPGATPPNAVQLGVPGQPPQTAPKPLPPVATPATPPPGARPPVANPPPGARPPSAPSPGLPPPGQRQVRQVPLTPQAQPGPQTRQVPPSAPRYMPVPQRQAPPPQMRNNPPPQMRPAAPPPQMRPAAPPPQMRPAAPPPQMRPAAPPPQMRPMPAPAARPAPPACTPQMRAARQC